MGSAEGRPESAAVRQGQESALEVRESLPQLLAGVMLLPQENESSHPGGDFRTILSCYVSCPEEFFLIQLLS